MNCPVCHKHRLRSKEKHGIRYHYCIGCRWEKAIKGKPTVMDEVIALVAPEPATMPAPVVPVVDVKETLKVVDEKIVINSPIYSPTPPAVKKSFLKKLFGK